MTNALYLDDLELDEDLDLPSAPGSFTCRPYQNKAVDYVIKGWEEVLSQLLVMATGTGKTVVFSYITNEVLSDPDARVLILAHLGELLDQAAAKLEKFGLHPSLEKADSYATPHDKVVLASWQTLSRDARLMGWDSGHFTHIIVDEAHRAMSPGYRKILNYFSKAKILGVTATADRGDKKSLGDVFQSLAFEYGLRDACLDGWLVRPYVKTLPIKIDLQGIKTSGTADGSDLDRVELGHRIEPFLQDIANEIYKIAAERKHMIFLPTVDSAEKMAAAMNNCGFRAVAVSGDDPDREIKTAQYRSGHYNALCNCMLYTEGFDHDQIDCITVLRVTKIRALLAQCVGRGTRPLEEIIRLLNSAKDKEERKRIIAESRKPNLLILDPLWLTEKLDIAKPAELVARNAKIAQRMAAEGDLLQAEEEAERDLLDSLKKELAKHSRKKSMVIDPLQYAINIGDEDLLHYEPTTQWEAMEITHGQTTKLTQLGIDVKQVSCRGQAHKILGKLFSRSRDGLAVPRQLEFFRRLGIDASHMTAKEAAAKQKEQIAKWNSRRQGKGTLSK